MFPEVHVNQKKNALWIRVNRREPCKVCEKPDWCTMCPELGIARCMRIESTRASKAGGWIHELGENFVPPVSKPLPETSIHADALMHGWRRETTPDQVEAFAAELGISTPALNALGIAWAPEYRAFAFPMSDSEGKVIGVRLRNREGKKWAVKGSRQGLFVPSLEGQKRVFVCEGPTDTAACLSMGFFAIGRPCCLGCEEMLCESLRRLKVRECVLALDNDTAGINGTEKLITFLRVPFQRLIPPAKDMRAFVVAGGTAQLVESMLAHCRTTSR